ncbi:VOC family protein [Capnocytophaga sp. oral taxon 338]|uniref:VOC family protein n=1 Tax=Capnocytophaga sp. oral taxon 338 TaxID=710239 RepID=UPI000202B337|nr:VOC family protein [Capnocytophaga sp. oral taxon 338]EGD33412.1 glyoxalase [Capnocytophaga sp. oral taxon 338 str. F0234]
MKIDHIALYVKDLEVSKAFYETFFGAKSNELYHNPKTDLHTYFLSFDSGARLEIMWRPNLSERLDKIMNEGLIHFAFSVGSKEAVDALTQKIIAAGYECFSAPRTTGDGYYESVVLDPDGNMVEITI